MPITDKTIRASKQTWQTLREAAFYRNTHIKTVLDEIVSGNLDPIKIEVE